MRSNSTARTKRYGSIEFVWVSWAGLGSVALAWVFDRAGLDCTELYCGAGLGWAGLGWAGLGWAGLGWAGMAWAGLLGLVWLGWVALRWIGHNMHSNKKQCPANVQKTNQGSRPIGSTRRQHPANRARPIHPRHENSKRYLSRSPHEVERFGLCSVVPSAMTFGGSNPSASNRSQASTSTAGIPNIIMLTKNSSTKINQSKSIDQNISTKTTRLKSHHSIDT